MILYLILVSAISTKMVLQGVQMSASAQQSQKRQSAKMIVRNEQNIANLLAFLFRRISLPYPRVIIAPLEKINHR
jgi:hypothetical protein